MALQQAITYKSVPIPAAYIRVRCPQIDLTKDMMSFSVSVYPSQSAATDDNALPGVTSPGFVNVPYALTGGNLFQQAYVYLKTLPEFATAVNVMEAGQTV